MNTTIKKHLYNLNHYGITYLRNVFSEQLCKNYIKKFEKTFINFEKKYNKKLGNNGQTIQNYFFYNKEYLKFLEIKKVDEILKEVIDKDYVLINSSLTNRFKRNNSYKKNNFHLDDLGGNWHHDSRVIGKRRLDRGFSYIVIIMFDDFELDNGCTQYIEKSHLIRNKIPKRNGKYISKKILGKAGTIAIIDTGLWHKAGNPSENKTRWSIFSYYGPWFMKPYYDFPKLIKKNYKSKIKQSIKKILHCTSIPPSSELERVNTLKK